MAASARCNLPCRQHDRRQAEWGWLGAHHFRLAHLRFALMMTARAQPTTGRGGADGGDGRHALYFAEHGFAVEAIDGAAAGLDFACRDAAARDLRLSLRQADADTLPFSDESFDYVLSWNVIFHGTMGDVGRRLAEIWRVLKPGGLFQGTMLSKRDVQFGRGRPV